MTLKELAAEYRQSAVLLRKRLRDLRLALELAKTSEERWRIKRRIAELTPMLTQTNKITNLLEHYYDKGYYRDPDYSSNAFRTYFPATIRKRAENHQYGTDTGPTGYANSVLDQGRVTGRVRKEDRRMQINCMQKSKASEAEATALHSILMNRDPKVLEQLLPQIKKEK